MHFSDQISSIRKTFSVHRVRAALTAMGLPADARAETLAPEQWRELYGRLA